MWNMSLFGIKLVTFDATNTLLKFRVPPWEYYALVARDYGFTGGEDEIKSKFKESFKVMWEKHPNFGKNTISWQDWWRKVVGLTLRDHLPDKADVVTVANKLINEFRTSRCWNVADGGHNLLRVLHNKGVSLGVISNSDPRLRDILRNLDLYKHFEFVLTSYESGCSKPDKIIFDEALQLCKKNVNPNEAIHIGDDIDKDYKGAKAAGWHALLILNNLTEKPPAKEHVFRNLDELSLVIEKNQLKL